MKYFKVKSFFNNEIVEDNNANVRIFGASSTTPYHYINFLINGELVTEKELLKILKNNSIFSIEYNNQNFSSLTKEKLINLLFDVVEINKNKTYIFFGVRKSIASEF